MNFDDAFTRLIDVEKGYQNDPNDHGNWTGGSVGLGNLRGTKYGVSAGAYPGEDIQNLTLDRAKLLYRRDYWGPAGCDALQPEVKFAMFDLAVNSGVKASIRLLQKAVGEVQDGMLGPLTLQAAQSMNPLRLLLRLNAYRLRYICDARSWSEHGKGWTRRVADLQLEV